MENIIESAKSLQQLNETITKENFVLVYFSHEKCNVCKVLKPKVAEMLNKNFPKVKMIYADTVENPEIAGQNSIFAVPTIVTYVEGKEYFRRSRNIGIRELEDLIERPYSIINE